jgi:dihydroneopterin aldolase
VFEVRVNGLRFRGPHGVFESERGSGNEFLATITATVDGTADTTDSLSDTVDYSALADMLLSVSGSRPFATVEGLAGAFVDSALRAFPAIQSLEIVLDKLSPLGMPQVESCGSRIVRERR